MSKLKSLLIERFKLEAKIRSYRVIEINKHVVFLGFSKIDVNYNTKQMVNLLHAELEKGMPSMEKVDELLDQIETAFDL